MADRWRGTLYVGVTADLPRRMPGPAEPTPSITDVIAHEKRVKRWRRPWKPELIERSNPDWQDLFYF